MVSSSATHLKGQAITWIVGGLERNLEAEEAIVKREKGRKGREGRTWLEVRLEKEEREVGNRPDFKSKPVPPNLLWSSPASS